MQLCSSLLFVMSENLLFSDTTKYGLKKRWHLLYTLCGRSGEHNMKDNNILITEMIRYYAGDPKRIQHFIKVYTFAKMIGEKEKLPAGEQFILETAAIVHDIGIKPAEEKFGQCGGKLQEQEGPAVAQKLLAELGYPEKVIARVCYLVGHHHTYDGIDGMDYQILVEADFLVNLYEDGVSGEAVERAGEKIFRTKSGTDILETMFQK